MPDQTTYRFGQDVASEEERLAAVERAFDPVSQWALLRAGVRAGWHCWEVGAGRGSIARWLARIVGVAGHVLATDLDDQWFRSRPPEVTFRRHDIAADLLPDERFDLVHARFLLEHLAQPELALRRFLDVLRPGGVLVLEDSAGLQLDLTPATDVFSRLPAAWQRAGLTMGWTATYGAGLMSDLKAAGFVDLRGHQYRQVEPGGERWAHIRHGLERLRNELIDEGIAERELASALQCLSDPASVITGPPVMIAQGSRPLQP